MKERKRVLTESQLRKEKRRAAQDATGRAMMLMLLAAQDELDLDEQTCEEILVRAGRYAHHYDEHLIRMQHVHQQAHALSIFVFLYPGQKRRISFFSITSASLLYSSAISDSG